MAIPKDNSKLEKAKSLRREMTEQERRLWYTFLRTYPVKIYKQRIIGGYIVDFYCASAKLVIELDGSQHYEDKGMDYDRKRTEYLNSLGLEVLRFSNADVNERFKSVCEMIDNRIKERSPLSQLR
ncbi:MAG: endonuclease domain-containing protein [Oscillospiraceae bacterium]|nr:endonuclease domain-containing protein [Oscillospiraceae bacterium]